MLMVANRASNDISVVDWDGPEIMDTISGVESPNMMARSPKGNNVLIATGGRNPRVSILDPFMYEVVSKVKLSGDPHGIAVKR